MLRDVDIKLPLSLFSLAIPQMSSFCDTVALAPTAARFIYEEVRAEKREKQLWPLSRLHLRKCLFFRVGRAISIFSLFCSFCADTHIWTEINSSVGGKKVHSSDFKRRTLLLKVLHSLKTRMQIQLGTIGCTDFGTSQISMLKVWRK